MTATSASSPAPSTTVASLPVSSPVPAPAPAPAGTTEEPGFAALMALVLDISGQSSHEAAPATTEDHTLRRDEPDQDEPTDVALLAGLVQAWATTAPCPGAPPVACSTDASVSEINGSPGASAPIGSRDSFPHRPLLNSPPSAKGELSKTATSPWLATAPAASLSQPMTSDARLAQSTVSHAPTNLGTELSAAGPGQFLAASQTATNEAGTPAQPSQPSSAPLDSQQVAGAPRERVLDQELLTQSSVVNGAQLAQSTVSHAPTDHAKELSAVTPDRFLAPRQPQDELTTSSQTPEPPEQSPAPQISRPLAGVRMELVLPQEQITQFTAVNPAEPAQSTVSHAPADLGKELSATVAGQFLAASRTTTDEASTPAQPPEPSPAPQISRPIAGVQMERARPQEQVTQFTAVNRAELELASRVLAAAPAKPASEARPAGKSATSPPRLCASAAEIKFSSVDEETPEPIVPGPVAPPAGTGTAQQTDGVKKSTETKQFAGPAQQNLPEPAVAALSPSAEPMRRGGARMVPERELVAAPTSSASQLISLLSTGQPGFRAGEELGALPAPAAATPSPLTEALPSSLLRHVSELRHTGATEMSVVLKPDAGTELSLRLSMGTNGEVTVQARCEQGDGQLLAANWGEISHSLAQQGVRLGALEFSSDRNPDAFQSHAGNSGPSSDGQPYSQRHASSQAEVTDELPAVVAPAAAGARRGLQRPPTGATRSWEFWA